MSLMQNRYAISALSKKFKNKAYPNEIMIDKETGEIQIKCQDGNVISYNYLSRLNAHIDTLVFNSYNADLYGNIFEIELDSIDLPCTVQHSINLLDSPVEVTTRDFKAFIVSVDIDAINPSTLISRLDTDELVVDMEIQFSTGSTTKTIRLSEPLYRLNRLRIAKTDLDKTATNPVLKSLSIKSSPSFTGNEKFIIYSILLNVEEVEVNSDGK